MKSSEHISLIDVNPDNVASTGIFCIKNKKAAGYAAKLEWFRSRINQGLKIKIATDSNNKQLGFIEYIPSDLAWRPVKAENYFFIQCIAVMVKEERSQGIGSLLLQQCETDAKKPVNPVCVP